MNNASTTGGINKADLLIELGCEELPPKSLAKLAKALLRGFSAQLNKAGLTFDADNSRVFYTPRRLALLMSQVGDCQPHQVLNRKGPALSAAFDADGNPTPAAHGFARSVGKTVEELEQVKTEQGEWLFCKVEKTGESLDALLFDMLKAAMADLPIAKPMRWANNDFTFIRPLHWLITLYGDRVIEGEMFGLAGGSQTRGHRIHSPGPHKIATAVDYPTVLEKAFVMVDQDKRKQTIRQQATTIGAAKFNKGVDTVLGKALIDETLLDEVTNLVEWPRPVLGSFDETFLEVPSEALIASMQDHQKFFPVIDNESGELLARFITIANIDSKDPTAVREGFERVIRPRLADARFFWDQDNKSSIEDWLPRLDGIVFQNKLGTIGDKSRRMGQISEELAEHTGANVDTARRAGRLAKADLISHMVGEFPELQGTMGGYYALNSGEDPRVALAISEHYLPAFSGDELPSDQIGKIVALADRLDTLLGIFATGLKPSGNKDPFALRRAALGLIHILLDGEVRIDLDNLLGIGGAVVGKHITLSPEILADVKQFILDRLKNWLCDQGYATKQVNAVLDAQVIDLPDLLSRLVALQYFMSLEEAAKLADANKRIGNILRKCEYYPNGDIETDLLLIEEETYLFNEVSRISRKLDNLYKVGNYRAGLEMLAVLSAPIEAFFDNVMVMDEDLKVRENRLKLLAKLKGMFDRVANLAEAT